MNMRNQSYVVVMTISAASFLCELNFVNHTNRLWDSKKLRLRVTFVVVVQLGRGSGCFHGWM